MSSPEPIVYVFYGQDEPSLKERLGDFLNAFSDPTTADLNTSRLDGPTIDASEILAAAGALPFLADKRIVMVENLTVSTTGRAIIDQLDGMLPRLPDWARLAFIETGLEGDPFKRAFDEPKQMAARRPALKKLIQVVENDPRGRVLAFNLPAGRERPRWIEQRAARYGAAIEPKAAQRLAERIGEDLTLADSELVKLATYTNGERSITVEDVDLLTPYNPEAGIFDMVDALGQRQGERALALLQQLLDDQNEPPLRVFGMIVRQYRLLLQMKEQLERGQSVNSAGDHIGVHNYVARKLAEQARYYSLDMLEAIYRHLLQVDVAMKGQTLESQGPLALEPMEPPLALESLIIRLAGRG